MKLREFETTSGKKVLAGKDANTNEDLIKQVGANEEVFHTAKPGSPFVNIKGEANKKDIKEAAIFCARKSQDWRDNKTDVEVHHFKGKDIYKTKGMKLGTFGVKKFKVIKIKRKELE
ncbi:MAG: NFACT RNA binding domain-containing protein [Nanoarchaeota archaeon]|nr:NFACT RNA binding domain-containing protein [Nanoarchaeota archaeon]